MDTNISTKQLADRLKPVARKRKISTKGLTALERRGFVERRFRRIRGRTIEDVQARDFRGGNIEISEEPGNIEINIPSRKALLQI